MSKVGKQRKADLIWSTGHQICKTYIYEKLFKAIAIHLQYSTYIVSDKSMPFELQKLYTGIYAW